VPDIPEKTAQTASPYGALPLPTSEFTEPDNIGSTGVPMDSWIYPALERLAAMGFIPTQSISIRPWTRGECLRQLNEAEDEVRPYHGNKSLKEEAQRLISDLHKELAEPADNNSVVLESAYTRYGTIAGLSPE
jgi:hypothetical protein